MTRSISLLLSGAIAAAVVVLVLFSGATISQAASSLFGGAMQGANSVSLVSNTGNATSSDDFSGVSFDDANGTAFSSLSMLAADFNVTDDNCGAGSPRFQIRIDKNNDNVSDGNIFVYLGPSPIFTGCTQNTWTSSGNLIGNNDAGRWDFTQLGGPLGTYSQAPADVLAGKILGITIVTDSGWNASASGGDNEQETLIDNVQVNGMTYDFAPMPVTVTIVKYVDGAHASSTNAGTSTFAMNATWNSTSTGSGSGTFSLGPTGFNNPNAFEATTAQMTSGASYAVSEMTSTSTGATVGADCSTGASYRLVGYSTGDTLGAAASSTQSTTSPSLTNITGNKYIVVWNATCAPQAATTSTVTIAKYIDGSHATTSNASSSFPMTANYQASNLLGGNAGSDPYTIGPVGNGTPTSYEAQTVPLANGASYSTFERTNTSLVGANCDAHQQYRLVGYTTGDSMSAAQAATPTTSVPSFTNLQSNKFVIVWNATCASTTTPPTATTTIKVHIVKYVNGQVPTASTTNGFQFPMTSTWMASNLNGGATTSGSYVLGNGHGGAADMYGADTAAMNTGAYYTTSETVSTSTGSVLPTSAACETDKYRLLGYTTSNVSFSDAAGKTITTTAPSFSSFMQDQYVIVWNQQCNGSQNPPPTTSGCAASSTPSGYQRVNGTTGNDTVTLAPNTYFVGKGGNDRITGGNGNYIICTGAGNDVIRLGDGTATIEAGGGNNNIKHGNGAVWITTGSGNDDVDTGNGGAHVWTNAGNDTITTGSGADVIDAGGGNNTVRSGAGNDSITSGSGNDTINGQADTDTCSAGSGNNNVTNCEL